MPKTARGSQMHKPLSYIIGFMIWFGVMFALPAMILFLLVPDLPLLPYITMTTWWAVSIGDPLVYRISKAMQNFGRRP
jgi:hypothetical protein